MLFIVANSCPTLCDPIAAHQASLSPTISAQIHIHWVCDAIQPSYPMSPSSPPAFNLSQHQNLFQ